MIDHMIQNTDHYDILIVDDTPDSLKILSRMLKERGYRVRPATSGRHALKSIAARLPDLILLDVKMPVMDGYEVCRRLKSDEHSRHVPVIFISALGETAKKVEGFKAGGVDYITKPFETEEVLARVEIHLQLHELTEQLDQKVAERTEELHTAYTQLQRELAERKQMEAALWQSETLLNETQRLAKIGGWEWDVEQQTTFWTEETYRIHGFEPQAFTPGSAEYIDRSLACYDPADRAVIFDKFQRCVEHGDGYDLEFPFTSADGCRKWIRTTAVAEREKGRIIKIVGTIMDITERKQAEEKRQESEERLRLTLEAAQVGIFDWDVEKDRWYALPEYYTMLGYAPQEGLGDRKEWIARVHPDDLAHIEAKIQDVLARKSSVDQSQVYEYEARLRHADGTYRWMHVKGFGVKRDGQGRVTRILGIRMDITERKRAEEALRRLNIELDQRVLDRTAQLKAANKELEAFAYSVSHDLRAPLRHIDGFLELLQKKAGVALDEQGRHYMDTISNAAQKMGLLIDDLLTFSRMGRHAMSLRQVALDPLVRDIIRELEPDAAGRTVAWRIGELPVVRGDKAMLRMVLVNLVANALKFTRSRPQARIEISSLPGQSAESVIFVRDNGAGFDMAYRDKLFGVFQRLHSADEFEGIGIGLANVRRIIARHGGRTWAEGEVDRGATFYFSLPQVT